MNPADLSLGISPNLTTRPAPPQLTITPKNGRIPIPRVELEPIYVQLKAALGDGWNDYKDAIANFVTGKWNQAELSFEMRPLANDNTLFDLLIPSSFIASCACQQ